MVHCQPRIMQASASSQYRLAALVGDEPRRVEVFDVTDLTLAFLFLA
jgi:hypothetical protein